MIMHPVRAEVNGRLQKSRVLGIDVVSGVLIEGDR